MCINIYVNIYISLYYIYIYIYNIYIYDMALYEYLHVCLHSPQWNSCFLKLIFWLSEDRVPDKFQSKIHVVDT